MRMEGASDVDMLLAQVDDLSLLLPDDLQSAAPSAGPPAGSAMAEGKHRRTLHRQQGAHDTALESFGLEVNAAGRVTAAAQESGVALGSRVIEVNHEYHDEDEEQPLGAWVIVKCWVPEMAIQEHIANSAVSKPQASEGATT